jgi:hypothetical protein
MSTIAWRDGDASTCNCRWPRITYRWRRAERDDEAARVDII